MINVQGTTIIGHNVTLIPGDGVGPEVTRATRRVLEATGVPFIWEIRQLGLPPPDALDAIRGTKLVLKGPTAAPVGVDCIDVDAAVFGSDHDCTPEYAGMNKANPIPMMRCGVSLLRYLEEHGAADRLEYAIATVIAEGKTVAYDMKHNRNDPTAVGTSQVADGIIAKLKGMLP